MKHLLTIVAFLLLSNFGFAQISTNITPQSVKYETVRQSIENLPIQNLPKFDRERILKEDENTVNSNRFAAPLKVNYSLKNAGKWMDLPNGDAVWIFKVKAQGALSIQAMYNQFSLPEGATLHIYDEAKTIILGAFTSFNNKEGGKFATAIMKGDNMIFEYYVPAAKRGQGVIEIDRIDYGYRNTLSKPSQDKKGNGFGNSGSCNVNINCTAGNNWQDEKEGVVRIGIVTTAGSFWCTGSLINNANNDGTPYLLSAYHCQDNGTPLYAQWTFYFNYEASGCSNPSSQPSLQTVTGATEKSKNSASDFLLIELNNAVPAAYNPYYNGWNKGTTAPSNSTCIHHPSGDIKKIAVDNQSPTVSGYGGGSGTTHWQTVWNTGTTEGGSSGSPLFNANGQIIGQLHGGSASCTNLLGPDYYGRLSTSWTGGGTNSTRLSNWLDPSSTGVTAVNGYNPGGGTGGTGLINGCAGTSQYPSGTLTPTSTWQTASTQIYAGEYSVYNVVAGTTYEWSLCATDGGSVSYDSELTLTDASNNELDYNNDNCGTASKITWTATITGTVRVHVTENHCQTNSTSTTLVYRSVSGGGGSPNLTKQTDNLTVSGNSVTVSATVENTGTGAAGSFDVRFYASTNTIISTGDSPIYTATVNSLAASATTTVGSTIDLCTAGLTNGTTYYIGYIIDYNNNVTESNESDNTFAWTTQSATPNCASGCLGTSQYPSGTFTPTNTWQTAASNIYAGEYSVYNVVAGTTYEWSLCTADGGNASYDSELTLTDGSNNFLAYEDDVCGDDAKITWVSTVTGTVRVHVTEYNCQTNSTSTTLVYQSVGGGGTSPNLTKQTDNLTISGNSVTVSATIENAGAVSAGSFDVRFYASTNTIISTGDNPIYTATVNSLAAGATTTVGSTIDLCTAGLTNGTTYYIGYIIDYNNSITESDETDNTFAWTTQSATLNCNTGCTGTSQYPSGTFTPTNTWQTAASNIYAGEYSVYNVVAGTTYEWSLCTADGGNASYDSELTLTDASNNFLAYEDDVCGDDAKITWVSTVTGTVRVHVSEYNCQTNSTSTTLVYQSVGGGSTSPNLLSAGGGTMNTTGTTISVTANIQNNGTGAAGAFDVRFYASTNTTISTGDTEIYVSSIASLASNTTTQITFSVDLCNVTGFSPSGNYYIGFLIDEPDQVTESNETDNGSYFTSPVSVTCATNYTITTNVSPLGTGTVTGGGTYSSGSSATVTATPNSGWTFDSWKENGVTVSNNANYTFTVTADRTLEAVFTQVQYTITTSASPTAGGTTSGGGSYNNGSTASVTATANAGWVFDSWQENGATISTNFSYTFTVTGNRNLVAIFTQQQYNITTSANPTAGGTTSGGGTYLDGASVTVSATANSGWIFDSWKENGNTVSTNASYTFTVGSNRILEATFVQQQQQYTISTNASPLNGGAVTGGGTYNSGSSATVTATANAGWIFDSWKENGNTVSTNASYTFTVTGNRTLDATFVQQQYTISTNASPLNGGAVTGGGTYNSGSSATLTATANSGWLFDSWKENGNTVSTNVSYTFTVTGNRTLDATFVQQQFTITTSPSPTTGGTITGGGTYNSGSSATITGISNPGWMFAAWQENGLVVSTDSAYTFVVTGNRTLEAIFDIDVNTNAILSDVQIKVSPNPTSDLVNIVIEHPSFDFDKIQVYNIHSQLMQEANMNRNNSMLMDLGSLSEGIYFIQIFTVDNQHFVIEKVVKTN